jgi:hypothetical protein
MPLATAALQEAARLDTLPVDTLRRRIELALTVGTPDDDALMPITELDFSRRAPALPDRAAKQITSTPPTTPPQVARRTD